MAIDENKALVRRYFEDAPHNPAVCDEIFAENLHWHALYHTTHPDFVSSPQAEKEAYARHRQVWGDWIETINILIAEGDRVMVHWVGKGRQAGEYMNIPATGTGRQVELSGVYVFRIADGKIAEVWNLWDRLGELQQMGILPETKEIIASATK